MPITALICLLAGTPLSAARLEIALSVASEPVEVAPIAVVVSLSPLEGEDQEAHLLELDTGAAAELDLPAGSRWRVQATTDGYWSAAEEIVVPVDGAAVALRLYPAGILEGRVQAPGSATGLFVRLAPGFGATGGGSLPATRLPCDVEEARWRCTAPADYYDLSFGLDRLVSIRRWGVDLRPGETLDLGLLHFLPGSTIFGWVDSQSADLPPPGSFVELRPVVSSVGEEDSQPSQPPATELRRRVRLAATGHYQILGVPQGTWVVSARDERLVSRASPALIVKGTNQEIEAPPLLLQPPGSLELVFDGPVDPFERRWNFELSPLDPTSRKPLERMRGTASEEGIFVLERLAPGPYRLVLTGDFDPSWTAMEFDLGSEKLLLTVAPSLVGLQGSASLGGESLVGTVRFRRVQPKAEVAFATDGRGGFSGYLPREGLYQVEVMITEEDELGQEERDEEAEVLTIDVGSIDVTVARGERLAEVELALPGTEIYGIVLDHEYQPVPKATVEAIWRLSTVEEIFEGVGFDDRQERPGDGRSRVLRVKTDREGRFRLLGLPAGGAAVRAKAPKQQPGPWMHLILEEDREMPELVLRTRVLW